MATTAKLKQQVLKDELNKPVMPEVPQATASGSEPRVWPTTSKENFFLEVTPDGTFIVVKEVAGRKIAVGSNESLEEALRQGARATNGLRWPFA